MIEVLTGIVISSLLCNCKKTKPKQPLQDARIYFLKNKKDIEDRAKQGDILSQGLINQAVYCKWI